MKSMEFNEKAKENLRKVGYRVRGKYLVKIGSPLDFPKEKYKTIVIDPPWKVKCNLKDTRFYRCGKPMPYKMMSDEEIEKFDIDKFANKNCDLFMWTTLTKLPIALKIMEKWGFKYHITITWDKTNGIGLNGFHRKTELVIYGYKGKMGIDRKRGKYIPTLFMAKLTTHSTKPREFYELIRKRTNEPRIDIFARQRHEGFDAWGEEVESETQLTLKTQKK